MRSLRFAVDRLWRSLWREGGGVSQAARSAEHEAQRVAVRTSCRTAFSTASRERLIGPIARRRAPPGMQDGRVVTSSEVTPDRRQRLVGQLAREVHRQLPGPGDPRSAGGDRSSSVRAQTGGTWRPGCRGSWRGTWGAGRSRGKRPSRTSPGELARQRSGGQRAEGDDADQRALECPDIGLDAVCDPLERARPRRARCRRRGPACGGPPGGWRGREGDVGDEPGLEALAQAVLERLQVLRRPIEAEHDLAARRRRGR